MPGDGRPAWAVVARVDSKQAGAIAPLERGANSAKWLNLSGGGMKIGL